MNATPRTGLLMIVMVTTLSIQACTDATEPPVASTLEAVAGNPTSGLAGTKLGTAPRVRVLDQFGDGFAGAEVVFLTAGSTNGTVDGQTQITDADGIAQPRSWQLSGKAGEQTMIARTLTDTLRISVVAEAGPPKIVTFVQGNPLAATVGTELQSGVRVTDRFGNSLEGVDVVFSATSGSGTVTGSSQVTDRNGFATVGSWTLSTTAGAQVLTATVNADATGLLTVLAEADEPVALVREAGDGQEGRPNGLTPGPAAVRLLDVWGNGVPGVTVRFDVTAGDGGVQYRSATTDTAGRASTGLWMLGPDQGVNTVRASAAGLQTVEFSATASGTPLFPVLSKFSGDGTSCPVGTENCRFTVSVLNRLGQPLAGRAVTWSAAGKSLASVTNAKGRSMAPNLAASDVPGAAAQTARLDESGEEVVFTYSMVEAGQFNIEVRFIGTATEAQQAAFNNAAARWQEVITGDVPAETFTAQSGATAGICGVDHPAIMGTIDDLVIYVQVEDIDGPGQVLGRAGPCYIRDYETGDPQARYKGLPIVGVMQLDRADLAGMEANGTLGDVILHEVGHVLGIGSMWRHGAFGLVTGIGSTDPFFTGASAISGFILGGGVLVNGVPVEATGGQGTALSHWREETFGNELMTGFIAQESNPLSIMTIGSLMDMGYEVDFGAADTYAQPGSTFGLRASGSSAERVQLRELPMPAPRRIGGRH